MKTKIYRCNCRRVWSVQNRKSNFTASSILLSGNWTTELKPERSCNPRGFVVTERSREIIKNPPDEMVKEFVMLDKLVYNKAEITFNVKNGEYLYFADDGTCYLLKKKKVSLEKI
jgi:hypothetical protein